MSSMTVFQCLAYVVAVNAVTTVWVYIGHVKWLSFQTLALAMFLPTAMALCFTDDLWSLVVRVLGFKQPLDAVAFSGVAVYSVAAMVGACVVIDLLMGWAKLKTVSQKLSSKLDVSGEGNFSLYTLTMTTSNINLNYSMTLAACVVCFVTILAGRGV